MLLLLAVICWHDVRDYRIPNAWLGIGYGAAWVLGWLGDPAVLTVVLGAAAAFGALLAVSFVHPFGPGDVKLAGMIGAFVGPWRGLLAIVVALAFLGLVSWTLRRSPRQLVPFSPFLALGWGAATCGALGYR